MINAYVDSVAGNDGTGTLNDPSLPFQTIGAAASAIGASPTTNITFWLKGTHTSPGTGFVLPWGNGYSAGRYVYFTSWDQSNIATMSFTQVDWFSTNRVYELYFINLNLYGDYGSSSFAAPTNVNNSTLIGCTCLNNNGNTNYPVPLNAFCIDCTIGGNANMTAISTITCSDCQLLGSHSTGLSIVGEINATRCRIRVAAGIGTTFRWNLNHCSIHLVGSYLIPAYGAGPVPVVLTNSVLRGSSSNLMNPSATNKIIPKISNCYLYSVTNNASGIIGGTGITTLTTDPFVNSSSGDFTPTAELSGITYNNLTPGAIQVTPSSVIGTSAGSLYTSWF